MQSRSKCVKRCATPPGNSLPRHGLDYSPACFGVSRHLPFQGFDQPGVNVGRKHLCSHSLVDLNCLLGRVTHHPAVGTLRDVRFQLSAELYVRGLIEKVVELLQELFTCKQKRRPLFA